MGVRQFVAAHGSFMRTLLDRQASGSSEALVRCCKQLPHKDNLVSNGAEFRGFLCMIRSCFRVLIVALLCNNLAHVHVCSATYMYTGLIIAYHSGQRRPQDCDSMSLNMV